MISYIISRYLVMFLVFKKVVDKKVINSNPSYLLNSLIPTRNNKFSKIKNALT